MKWGGSRKGNIPPRSGMQPFHRIGGTGSFHSCLTHLISLPRATAAGQAGMGDDRRASRQGSWEHAAARRAHGSGVGKGARQCREARGGFGKRAGHGATIN